MNSENKPRRISEELWNHYETFKGEYLDISIKLNEPDVQVQAEIYQKIIFAPACQKLLESLIKSSDPQFHVAGSARSESLIFFIQAVTQATAGPANSSLVPATERTERGNDVIKNARRLARELQLIAAKGDIPVELTEALSNCLENAYAKAEGREVENEKVDPRFEGNIGESYSSLVVPSLFFESGSTIFDSLADGIEKWIQAGSGERWKDDTLPRRNYFIRQMARYFKRRFGRPDVPSIRCLLACLLGHEMTDASIRDVIRSTPR